MKDIIPSQLPYRHNFDLQEPKDTRKHPIKTKQRNAAMDSTTPETKYTEKHLDNSEASMSDDESASAADSSTMEMKTMKILTAENNKPDPNEVGWPTDFDHLTVVEC